MCPQSGGSILPTVIRACVSIVTVNTIFSAAIATLCGVFALSWFLSGQFTVYGLVALPLGMFFGTWCLVSIVTVPGTTCLALFNRSRCLEAEEEKEVVDQPLFPWRRLFPFSLAGLAGGGAVGTGMGWLLFDTPMDRQPVVLLGLLDGVGAAVFWKFPVPKYVHPTRLARVVYVAVVFAGLGLMAGEFTLFGVNAVVGVVVGGFAWGDEKSRM